MLVELAGGVNVDADSVYNVSALDLKQNGNWVVRVHVPATSLTPAYYDIPVDTGDPFQVAASISQRINRNRSK